jgi:two-component system nitrogen regulation sensor histidine kinase NtrY
MGFSLRAGHNAAVPTMRKSRFRLPYELRVRLFALGLALVGIVASGLVIWSQDWTLQSKFALLFVIVLGYWILISILHEQIIRPLQTLANVVAALREEDYAFRVRDATVEDAFGGLSLELNELADLLSQQRSGAIEAHALLRRVVEEIDVPLFAFNPEGVLVLANPAGEGLLQSDSARPARCTAKDVGLAHCLVAENESVISIPPGNSEARWLLRRSSFRQSGVPHTLIVLSDVGRTLREQERIAWQRLIRVLGHELNNSLAPIKSIAGALSAQIPGTSLTAEQRQDFARGLEIIETRAGSLNRFLQAYRQLAQMPPPVLRQTAIAPLVRRVAGLEMRLQVVVVPGPDFTLAIDPDQIEQMLINLVRNGVEAAVESREEAHSAECRETIKTSVAPEVRIHWELDGKNVALTVEDNGPGIANPANAFVPFYTTKPAGTGIGLALCRQIAAAHGGTVELSNRGTEQGCRVTVLLPRVEPVM